MNRNQKLIIFALILVLGVTFEIFKKISFARNQNGEINSLLSTFDMKPFAKTHGEGSLAGADRPIRGRATRRALPDPMNTLQQLAANTQEAKKEKLELGDTGNGKKADAKKKKKKKKKKSDKTNSDEENNEEVTDSGEDNLNADNDDTDSDNTNGSPNDIAAGNGASPIQPASDEQQTPIAELISTWSADLLRTPDYKLLNEFITLKQTGGIPDEVFYPVIQMLLEDNREPIQVMGVYALGATPSPSSFERLVQMRRTASFGSQVSQNISTLLQNYSNLNQLNSLRMVLYSSDDLEAIRVAAQLVEQAASRYLTQAPGDDVESQENTPPTKKQHSDIFQGFKSILESLAESSTDQQVVSAATQALNRIQQYLPEVPTENTDDGLVSTL
jgi:hypothetical protein